MKKFLSLLIVASMVLGCTSTKNIMGSWMGRSKHDLIMNWGPPTQTTSDGNNGEVLVYATHNYYVLSGNPVDYWEYRMMYANSNGILYHWRYARNPNPPERVDVRIL